ncbi:MAG TPA: hypothetical protein VGN63_18315 [Flavisolibacter sp.]|jgi:hypothetical protein|nr:hypothetical protein [Flavisolibacter sp.]
MRIIKLGLISFCFLFLLITLISLLFPSQIRLSRATNLPNEKERIFSLLRKEETWHPAYQDSASSKAMAAMSRKTISQTDSTYVVQLQQEGRKPVVSGWQVYGTPQSDSLTLQWYMDFTLSWYPWEKFSSLFYERTYGTMMEKGLANLKEQMVR